MATGYINDVAIIFCLWSVLQQLTFKFQYKQMQYVHVAVLTKNPP